MLISTPSQWAILALVLIAGWFFGLASHSGGRKWKDRYAAERDAHAAHRKDVETRVSDRDRRVADLERENARLATMTPATTTAPVRSSIRPAAAARPAYTSGERRGWFDWGNRS